MEIKAALNYDFYWLITGIIRDDTCTYVTEWQAYKCPSFKHYTLTIESMDKDTETRRISPVAILGDGYLDLINGPQDHGWCSGYTCRKRLSTFQSIVALSKQKLILLHKNFILSEN